MDCGTQVIPFHKRESIVWESSVSPTEKLLLLAINEFLGANGCCWPSRRRLAGMTGFTERTIGNAVERLRQAGIVATKKRFKNGTREVVSCEYYVDWDRLGDGKKSEGQEIDSSTPGNLIPDPQEIDSSTPGNLIPDPQEIDSPPVKEQHLMNLPLEKLNEEREETSLSQLSFFEESELVDAIASTCKIDLKLVDPSEIREIAVKLAEAGYDADDVRKIRQPAGWTSPPYPRQIPTLIGRVRKAPARASPEGNAAWKSAEASIAAEQVANREAIERVRPRWLALSRDERDRRIGAEGSRLIPVDIREEQAMLRFAKETQL